MNFRLSSFEFSSSSEVILGRNERKFEEKKGVKRIDTNFCESFYFAAFAVYESYIVLLLLTRQRLARD